MSLSSERIFTFIHIVFTPVLCFYWPQCALGSGLKASSRLPTPTRRQRRRLGVTYFLFFIFFLCSVTSEQRRAERYAAAAAAAAAAFKPCSQNRLDFYSLINRREAQKWPSAWNPLNGSPHTISRGRFCGNSREKKSWLRFLPPPQRHLLWHRAVTLAVATSLSLSTQLSSSLPSLLTLFRFCQPRSCIWTCGTCVVFSSRLRLLLLATARAQRRHLSRGGRPSTNCDQNISSLL